MTGAGRHPTWPQRARRIVLACLCLVTLGSGALGAFRWSLIPVGIHSRIAKVEYQSESGYHWRILHLTDGQTWVIDRRITNQLGDWQRLHGQTVRKQPWQRSVRIGHQRVPLVPSVEFWKVLFTFAALGAFVLWRARRSEPEHRSSAPKPPLPSPLTDGPEAARLR